jgi:predicted nucleotidyltransferase
MKDQELVERFLDDFVKRITNLYIERIDFILLFGSAARGEWKKGVSDIDMIIQLKDAIKKDDVYKRTEEIFWELDEKYDTKFKEVCSMKEPKKLNLVEAIRFAEREIRLYVPFEIIGPGEIDWEECEFHNPLYKVGAFLIFPKSMFFLKIKAEGKILFGRDIIKKLKPRLNWRDIPKMLLNPYHLSILSVLTVPFFPNFAVKHAIKAILYEIESVLIFLERPIVTGMRNVYEKVRGIIENKYIDWRVVEEAFDMKYDWEENIHKLSYKDKIVFCWKVLSFVVVLGWMAVFFKIYSTITKKNKIFVI